MPGPAADRALLGLLIGVVVVPAVVVVGGVEAGVPFTTYREPKLVAAGLLGWTFVLAYLAARGRRLDPRALRQTLSRPFFALFLAFLVYGGASRAWVRVPENHLYEWNQYLLLFVLTVLLDLWARERPEVRPAVHLGLVVSLVPVVVVGYLQLAGAVPFLVPIDPGYGVRHASLLGYKNPAALAVAGHLWLLLGAGISVLRSRRPWPLRLLVASYAAAVVLYLATLQSRTAVAATAGAAGLVGLLNAARHRRLPGGRGALALLLAAGLALAAVVTAAPALRERFASIASYLAQPSTLLDSDRGVYLRNTLAMVEDRPFGVGLGDWQTWYPVYRRHDRYRAFDDTFQVRRAHGDHVQLLGELGWPGLALWWSLLGAALAPPLRRFLRHGRRHDLLLVGQLAFFLLAMAGDYVVELPYLKLQLFLVCFLAVSRFPGPEALAEEPARAPRRSPTRGWLAAALVGVALLQLAWYAGLGWRSAAAARLEVSFRSSPPAPESPALARRARLGRRFLVGDGAGWTPPAGHAKTFFRPHLVLARDAAAGGDEARALASLRRALALHPFHPGALGLCAEILGRSSPEQARQCAELRDHVLHEATDGLDRPYPRFLLF